MSEQMSLHSDGAQMLNCRDTVKFHPMFAGLFAQQAFYTTFALRHHRNRQFGHRAFPHYPLPPPLPRQGRQLIGATSGRKRRGGPGGLNKVCGVSPELQAIVGQPEMSRTEIVKQLWVYIRKHNLQDPGNKRKIICDDALRAVFETDYTDMFKMNKLLARHITALDPSKQAELAYQAKRLKIEADSVASKVEQLGSSTVTISNMLAKFFGSEEKKMLRKEVMERIWEYIKLNQLEDPVYSMVIVCDAKLHKLLLCESIFASEIPEMLAQHFD